MQGAAAFRACSYRNQAELQKNCVRDLFLRLRFTNLRCLLLLALSFANSDVSRDSDVQLSLYIRIPNPNADAKESESSSQDVFLGNVNLEPRWDDQMQDAWFPLHGGTGKVRVQLAYKRDNVRIFVLYASVSSTFLM